jgi:membrane protein implicated in regulation of membrane protease activity
MEEMHITYIWLLAGVLFLLLEAFGFPGTGLMFAGFGAITTGSFIYFGLLAENATAGQWMSFFIASAVWAAVLWKPLQKWRAGKQPGYQNMVGDTAYVGSNGLTHKNGEVTWSGTIMKARLADNAGISQLEAGSSVTIVAVKGTTLIVKPQN